MPEVQTITLHIYLIKEGLIDHEKIMKNRPAYGTPFEIYKRDGGEILGLLYIQDSRPKPASWLSFFAGVVDGVDEARVITAAAAATLLVHQNKRVYAVCFGSGRYMLQDGATEERFGLRATLNAIDAQKIRSLDRRTLETNPRHTREQVSREAGIEAFGVDVERDLLRGLTATPSDPTLGSKFDGKDALTTTVSSTVYDLPELLDRYRRISEEERYRENFEWVDNIAEVRDKKLIEALDIEVAAILNTRATDRVWLAVPVILDWSRVGGFTYRTAQNAGVFPDLYLEEYFDDCRQPGEIGVEELKRDVVRYLDAVDDGIRVVGSVYKCLCAEVEREDETYILNEGKWYRINTDFATEVNRIVGAMRTTQVALPDYGDDSEGAYNERVATASNGDLFLMDRRLIEAAPGRGGRIEFCDLFSRDRVMVHVKRYGGSSVLSHLFEQGVVSAETFFRDSAFRTRLNQVLPDSHRLANPDERIDAGSFEVAYAIVEQPGRALDLPFFSRVALKNAWQWLTDLGYDVTLTRVPQPG